MNCSLDSTTRRPPSAPLAAPTGTTSCMQGRHLATDRITTNSPSAVNRQWHRGWPSRPEGTTDASYVCIYSLPFSITLTPLPHPLTPLHTHSLAFSLTVILTQWHAN